MNYELLGNILEYITLVLIIISFLYIIYKKIRNKGKNSKDICSKNIILNFIDKKVNIFFLLMLLIYAILLLFKLSDIPKGIHVDEAGMSYDAMCISKYGVDRYLYKLPIYFINFGGGQNALYTYLESIVLLFAKFSVFTMRLPAVLVSVITVIVLYYTLKKNIDSRIALLATFLMIICPWHFMKSRWGLESYLLSGFFTIAICMLCKAVENKKIYMYVLAGLLFGLTLYTYAVSYIIVPIFLIFMIIYLIYLKKVKIKQVIAFVIPLGILGLPLVLMLAYNNGILPKVNLPVVSIPTLWSFRGSEISLKNISANMPNIYNILFSNDFLIYNGFKEFGTLYKMTIPFVFIGFVICFVNIVKTIRKKEIHLDYVFMAAFIASFLCMLVVASPNINKCNAIYIPMIYFAVRAIFEMGKRVKILIPIILILYCINTAAFYKYYFINYANIEEQSYFEYGITDALEKAETLEKEKIYIAYNFEQPYIYTLLVNKISPYEFNDTYQKDENNRMVSYKNYYFYIPDEIDTDSVYIIKNSSEEFYIKKIEELQDKGYSSEKFGLFNLFYK